MVLTGLKSLSQAHDRVGLLPERECMNNRVLVVLGHPDTNSFCGATALAYAEGARSTGAEVKEIRLGELAFDPILHHGYHVIQELEPDLQQTQKDILWAEHIVWVYPTWWGGMPALMKGFIERIILPGFAFKYREQSPLWDKLMTGRSAHLFVTMDAPTLYYRMIVGSPGHKQMMRAILGFCGFKPIRLTQIGMLKRSKPLEREQWLKEARQLGELRI